MKILLAEPSHYLVYEDSLPYKPFLLDNDINAPTDVFAKTIVTTSFESLSIYLALS